MNPSSFEFITECDRDSFTDNDPLTQIRATEPPPILTQSTSDEILLSSNVNRNSRGAQQVHEGESRPKRMYFGTNIRQRTVLSSEFAKHGISKPIKYYQDKTRLCPRTIKRLIGDIQTGKDITKPGKRGRNPNTLPNFSSKLPRSFAPKATP